MPVPISMVKQQGSILLWGMVILLVMTVLAFVGARMASTDIKIAGNEIYQVLAYQAAESAIERSTDLFFQNKAATANDLTTVLGPFSDNTQGGAVSAQGSLNMSHKIPCGAVSTLAMSVSVNEDDYSCYLFAVDVEARVAGTGAESSHALGFMRLTPGTTYTTN